MAKTHTFGDKLKQIRKMYGLNQTKFASLFGISRKTLGKYERGITPPRGEFIDKVSKHFGIPINFFFEEETEEVSKKKTKRKERPIVVEERTTLIVFDRGKIRRIKCPKKYKKVSRKQKIPNNVWFVIFGFTLAPQIVFNLLPATIGMRFLFWGIHVISWVGILLASHRLELSLVGDPIAEDVIGYQSELYQNDR